jgi:Skp family chaperone for outer membrane proteins
MNVPVPNNRLIALTLVGGLLTAFVATGLAFPGALSGVTTDSIAVTNGDSATLASDAPEPNESFTPAVKTDSAGEEYEDEDESEEEEHEDEDEDESEKDASEEDQQEASEEDQQEASEEDQQEASEEDDASAEESENQSDDSGEQETESGDD